MDERWTYPFGNTPPDAEDAYALFRNMPGFDEPDLGRYLQQRTRIDLPQSADMASGFIATGLSGPNPGGVADSSRPSADNPFDLVPPPQNPRDFAPDVGDFPIVIEPPLGDEAIEHGQPAIDSKPRCSEAPDATLQRIHNYEADQQRLGILQSRLPRSSGAERSRIQAEINQTQARIENSRQGYLADKRAIEMCSA